MNLTRKFLKCSKPLCGCRQAELKHVGEEVSALEAELSKEAPPSREAQLLESQLQDLQVRGKNCRLLIES